MISVAAYDILTGGRRCKANILTKTGIMNMRKDSGSEQYKHANTSSYPSQWRHNSKRFDKGKTHQQLDARNLQPLSLAFVAMDSGHSHIAINTGPRKRQKPAECRPRPSSPCCHTSLKMIKSMRLLHIYISPNLSVIQVSKPYEEVTWKRWSIRKHRSEKLVRDSSPVVAPLGVLILLLLKVLWLESHVTVVMRKTVAVHYYCLIDVVDWWIGNIQREVWSQCWVGERWVSTRLRNEDRSSASSWLWEGEGEGEGGRRGIYKRQEGVSRSFHLQISKHDSLHSPAFCAWENCIQPFTFYSRSRAYNRQLAISEFAVALLILLYGIPILNRIHLLHLDLGPKML